MWQQNSNTFGGRVRRDSLAPFEKSDKSMEIEQRYVIKFFIDEGMKSLDILMRLHKHYCPRAFSRFTLYFWVSETRRGRTDISKIPGLGKTPDEDLATVIARRHEKILICLCESWCNPYGSRP
jgi:hypothetical protein